MAYTNFIGSGVSVNGAPLVPGGGTIPLSGNYFFVNSVSGSDGNLGTYDNPFATLKFALTQATAAIGDTIVLEAGHAETISAAAGIAVNKSGVFIIGLGSGNDRPVFTFATATSATMTITAANVTIANITATNSLDQIVSPFVISGANCTFGTLTGPIQWTDSATNVEAVQCILTTAGASNLNVNLKYLGQTGGSHCARAVNLVGVANAVINCDFYGKASTAWVNFTTTACTGIEVYGYMYNSGTTNFTKDVVDTVTGSTWFASFFDGSAGYAVSGGSGSALGPAAAATVIADLGVPTANSTANALERDVIGNKTDTAASTFTTTKSLMAYMGGVLNMEEVGYQSTQVSTVPTGTTLFTVAGGPIMITGLVSIALTSNGATANTFQYSTVSTLGSLAGTISGASATLANAVAGTVVTLIGTALSTAPVISATGVGLMTLTPIIVQAGTITMTVGVGTNTGTWAHYIRYKPLTTGVTVV